MTTDRLCLVCGGPLRWDYPRLVEPPADERVICSLECVDVWKSEQEILDHEVRSIYTAACAGVVYDVVWSSRERTLPGVFAVYAAR